jgi:hypothetical protein
MTLSDFISSIRRQARAIEPVAKAIVAEPFDDGLVEIERLLRLDQRPELKQLYQ